MGCSPFFIHRNATIFPDPEKFDPDRWIRTNGKTARGERLDRYLTAFTKGSRACLGIKYVQLVSLCLRAAMSNSVSTAWPMRNCTWPLHISLAGWSLNCTTLGLRM